MLTRYEHDIYSVDAEYVRPKHAAIHLILENGRVAFVDTGCNDSIPNALRALDELGVSVDSVDYVMLSHIHLDHAGGAGTMMKLFPNARLVVHPRGAWHMAKPARLMESVATVYGIEETRRLYGEVLPIDASRIIEATHETSIDLAGRKLLCLDAPGHAKHHIAIVDSKSGHIFSGDIFGLSYPELDTDGRQFVFPTTTPVQFDPQAMHASIEMLMSYRPQAIYLTHFGQTCDVAGKALDLHRMIDAHVAIALREKKAGAERHARIRVGLDELLLEETKRFGCRLADADVLKVFDADLELNTQGLVVWLDNDK
jgi:glyoxylase-like metal-dependent hydrolase (beta-lactamase superfamily II)